jgi:hypothetical protein
VVRAAEGLFLDLADVVGARAVVTSRPPILAPLRGAAVSSSTMGSPATRSAHPSSARLTKYAVSRGDSKRSEYCFECAACMIRLATSKVPIRSGVNSLDVAAVPFSSGTTAD